MRRTLSKYACVQCCIYMANLISFFCGPKNEYTAHIANSAQWARKIKKNPHKKKTHEVK